MCEIKLK